MYSFIKTFLFRLNPERAHHLSFWFLKNLNYFPFLSQIFRKNCYVENKLLEKELFGLKFKNPVGLAAGLDKDAIAFNSLANFGFGFIEVGTLTPKPQPGNDKPRLFRLIKNEALINRMGFNNNGVDAAVLKLAKRKHKDLIIGGNIGKNKLTPNEKAVEDYLYSFSALFDVVDYFVVNVSSPNTPNLRDLQEKEPLTHLLNSLQNLNKEKNKPKPILLKIAPDLSNSQLNDIIDIVNTTKIAGVIATNTTISREGLSYVKEDIEKLGAGGLSGLPLKNRSTEVIRYLKLHSHNAFPIIGVGGIHSANDAIEKIKAGADLIQIYTGFIYKGPGLVKQINTQLIKMQYKNNE
ncbi:MAG: quinone-dependent dihydroorotate dehydrogenase [Bacteroidetes bacterium]|nr:quinone-dependent dihydroorotate dehydrogenase [Bacteroidota bacterium]